MKLKVAHVCVTLVACSAWWMGCSSDDAIIEPRATPGTPEGGVTVPEGGTNEGGPIDSGRVDAAKDTGTDAPITGGFVDLTYGAATCPAFVPCGGDPKGAWNVTGGCVREEIFAPLKNLCPTIAESNVKFQARGTVVTDATNVARKTEVKFSATFAIPQNCKNAAGGSCAILGPALVAQAGGTAVCVDAPATNGCTCNVTNGFVDNTTQTYTVGGNTLTTGAGNTERTFEYCVAGNQLKYSETTTNTVVPGVFVLTK